MTKRKKLKKAHVEKQLTEKELAPISGGVLGLEQVSSFFFRAPSDEQAPSIPPQRAQGEQDGFVGAPAPKRPMSAVASEIAKFNSRIASALERLAIPNDRFSDASEVERHLRKVRSFQRALPRQESAIAKNKQLSEALKNDALSDLKVIKDAHANLIKRLEAVKGNFDRAAAFSASRQNLTQLSAEGLDGISGALADLQKGTGISAFSDKLRQGVEENRNALVEKLSKLASAANRAGTNTDLAMKAMALVSKLKELVIPEGAGPRIRFEQARYAVGAFHGPLAQKKLEALAVATGREEAKQLSAQKSKLDVSTSAVDGRLRVQYPGVDFFAPDKKQRVRLAEIELSEKYGLKSSATVSSTNGNLHESISQLMKLAQTQNTCILRVPDHAMAISTDPKSNTYRFFDPNIGVYVFDNPREFAEQVIHFVNMNYNKSTYSPYNTHPLSKVGGGPQPPLSTMSAHHQLSVKQALLGADRSLGSGICAAMSNHVARWFLEHPGHTEPITSEMLGLDEFQPQIALARRGDTLQQHRFMEKARETYLDAADSMPGGRQLIANMDALEQKDGLNAVIKHLADQLQKNPNDPLLVALQKSYSAKHEQFTFRAKAALAKGDALYKLGKYDAALQKYLPGLSGLVTGNVHSVLLTSGKSGTDEALKHVAILLQVGPYDLSLILLAKTLLAAKQAGRSIGILPPRVESQAPSIVVGPAAASQAAAQPDATGQFFLMFTPVALQK